MSPMTRRTCSRSRCPLLSVAQDEPCACQTCEQNAQELEYIRTLSTGLRELNTSGVGNLHCVNL